MKKIVLALSALSMSAAVSACSMNHDDGMAHGNMPPSQMAQNDDMGHRDWNHKEHMKMMTEYFFNKMDKNGDGYVSRKEFDEYFHKWFRQADSNHDGRLTVDEVRQQMKREKEEMKSDMQQMHSGNNEEHSYDDERSNSTERSYNDEHSYNDNGSNSSYGKMSPSSNGMNATNNNDGYTNSGMNSDNTGVNYNMNAQHNSGNDANTGSNQ